MNIFGLVINDEEFKTQYLEAANAKDINVATKFWNTYNVDPIGLLNNRQFLLLRDRLFELLRVCQKIDADAFAKIHKGHPYYFIGISSYLLDDFQTAIYFIDAAVTEDLNSGADPISNPRPSTRFLMLQGDADKQAGKVITRYTQAKVERALEHYQNKITKDQSIPQLTLNDLRTDFICYALRAKKEPGLRTLVTAFITYCTEWDIRKDHFESGVKEGTSEPFFLHLFRGCILFESLIRHNPNFPTNEKTLNGMLNEKKIRDRLKTNAVQGKGSGFELTDLFNRLQGYNNSISEAVKISYIARNTLGHTLGWNENISQSQYQNLYFIIASSCLHTIACLWKTP
jgi:hypothetical protein